MPAAAETLMGVTTRQQKKLGGGVLEKKAVYQNTPAQKINHNHKHTRAHNEQAPIWVMQLATEVWEVASWSPLCSCRHYKVM